MLPLATTRRSFLQGGAALALAAPFPAFVRAAAAATSAAAAAEKAHAEIWRRFIDPYNILLDYTDLAGRYERPTPEECRLGQPNALGWWTPIENGGMFNGLYLDAAVLRAQRTRAAADRDQAARLADGLLRLATDAGVKGFVARGFATDGRTTYPMGSNDQTAPWFYGLWRYVRSGLADASQRTRMVNRMVEVGEVLAGNGWRMPAAEPFGFRGSFAEATWDGAPRLLFLLKAMQVLTGDPTWARRYEQALAEKGAKKKAEPSRLEMCALGLESRPKKVMWTGSVSVACLRELWEVERNEQIRAKFARGLILSAEYAAGVLPLCRKFDPAGRSKFEGDWRKLLPLWKSQESIAAAEAVAREQLAFKNRISPRRREETQFVREPAFAAWIVALCPDRAIVARHRDAVLETIAHYHYDGLRYSQFFPAESAWERLQDSR